jgi:hypothetical protein
MVEIRANQECINVLGNKVFPEVEEVINLFAGFWSQSIRTKTCPHGDNYPPMLW